MVVAVQQLLQGGVHLHQRARLRPHHVLVVHRRAADGLARVVDDRVQAGEAVQHHVAEALEGRDVAEVQADHVEAGAPLGEVLGGWVGGLGNGIM